LVEQRRRSSSEGCGRHILEAVARRAGGCEDASYRPTMIRPACAVAASVLTLASARRAHASEGAVDLSAANCGHLHVDEVARVLNIELATVSREWAGPEHLKALLSCDDSQLNIVVSDPVTDKRLTRTVTFDWDTGDHDRTVALLVSQLFLTSWTELLLAHNAATSDLRPRAQAPLVAVRAAETIARASLRPPAISGSIALLTGPRVRELDSPLVSAQVTLRPSLLVAGRWRLLLDVGYERGSASRTLGTVVFSLASASVGFGGRWTLGPAAFDVDLGGGVAYVDMQGNPSPGAVAASASGTVAEGFIDAGPTFALGPTRIGLLLAVGASAPGTVAHVTSDRDVSIGGLSLGASLVVGAADAR
jgi:hypothetical protein